VSARRGRVAPGLRIAGLESDRDVGLFAQPAEQSRDRTLVGQLLANPIAQIALRVVAAIGGGDDLRHDVFRLARTRGR